MNDPVRDTRRDTFEQHDFELHPPRGAPFEEFSDWLARQETQTRDPTDDRPPKHPDTSAPSSTETRVFLSTLPYGLFWVATAFIAAHMTGHVIDPTRRMVGLGMLTWATALGCELTRCYAMGEAYPSWGMWGWVGHPTTKRLANKVHRAIGTAMNDGRLLTVVASLALPAIFGGIYAFFALIAHAQQLWMLSVLVSTGLHIIAAARQCYTMWKVPE